jgi:hypothetical protein
MSASSLHMPGVAAESGRQSKKKTGAGAGVETGRKWRIEKGAGAEIETDAMTGAEAEAEAGTEGGAEEGIGTVVRAEKEGDGTQKANEVEAGAEEEPETGEPAEAGAEAGTMKGGGEGTAVTVLVAEKGGSTTAAGNEAEAEAESKLHVGKMRTVVSGKKRLHSCCMDQTLSLRPETMPDALHDELCEGATEPLRSKRMFALAPIGINSNSKFTSATTCLH